MSRFSVFVLALMATVAFSQDGWKSGEEALNLKTKLELFPHSVTSVEVRAVADGIAKRFQQDLIRELDVYWRERRDPLNVEQAARLMNLLDGYAWIIETRGGTAKQEILASSGGTARLEVRLAPSEALRLQPETKLEDGVVLPKEEAPIRRPPEPKPLVPATKDGIILPSGETVVKDAENLTDNLEKLSKALGESTKRLASTVAPESRPAPSK